MVTAALFRGHTVHRATRPGSCAAFADLAGNVTVDEHRPSVLQRQVGGLKVAVHDASAMDVVQRRGELHAESDHIGRGEAAGLVECMVKGRPCNILEHQIGQLSLLPEQRSTVSTSGWDDRRQRGR